MIQALWRPMFKTSTNDSSNDSSLAANPYLGEISSIPSVAFISTQPFLSSGSIIGLVGESVVGVAVTEVGAPFSPDSYSASVGDVDLLDDGVVIGVVLVSSAELLIGLGDFHACISWR